jgi:3-deoxy-manno-octulosonate cytidylyltransferase (CMP-KDO synthetase)
VLERVYAIAQHVKTHFEKINSITSVSMKCLVATEDARIVNFCNSLNIPVVLTSDECETGSDRCLEAVQTLIKNDFSPDFVINLQGDNPLCPPWFLIEMIEKMLGDTEQKYGVFTPCEALTYKVLNTLRENKKTTPFSGTTVTFLPENHAKNPYQALWFSKNIIPALRKEPKEHTLETLQQFSGVWRHIGLYGYRYEYLEQFCKMPFGIYEQSEGLEQLRFLEAGIPICMIPVNYQGFPGTSGVDSPEDIIRYEKIMTEYGDILDVQLIK